MSLSLLDLPKKSSASGEDSDQEDWKKAEKEVAWAAHKIVSLLDSGLTVRDGDTIRAAQPKDIAFIPGAHIHEHLSEGAAAGGYSRGGRCGRKSV